MSVFLEQYVCAPLKDLLHSAPARDALPNLSLKLSDKSLLITIGNETLSIARPTQAGDEPQAPSDDVADEL